MWLLVQWVRGGHKVSWLNAWLSNAEPLDSVLGHVPDLDLLRELRHENLVEAALRLVTPGDMPHAISPEHDAAALSAGFRIDLLRSSHTIAYSLAPSSLGWLLSPASGELLGRDHPRHAGRHLDETLLEVTTEMSRLDLISDRDKVDQALAALDAVLHGCDWPRLMHQQRLALLRKSARVLVILDQALATDAMTLSTSLSATRSYALRQLAAPARRAAEAAFALDR